MKHLPLIALLLAGCSPSISPVTLTKATTDVNTLVSKGALFCAKAQGADGAIVVMLANAVGVPVSVMNQTAADVAAACKLVNMIPVMPPANPGAAPLVATITTLPPVA